LNKLGKEIKTK